jgi:hypothetical protein
MTVHDLKQRLGSGYELTEWIAYLNIMAEEEKKAIEKQRAARRY